MILPRSKRTKKGISSIDETPYPEVIELVVEGRYLIVLA